MIATAIKRVDRRFYVTLDTGENLTLAEAARRAGVRPETVLSRVKRGAPPSEAFAPPSNHRRTRLDVPLSEDEEARIYLDVARQLYERGERDRPGLTLSELGELFGVSHERIRQIESIALKKLRLQHGQKLRPHLEASLESEAARSESFDQYSLPPEEDLDFRKAKAPKKVGGFNPFGDIRERP